MSAGSRVLKTYANKITQAFKPENNKHLGIDIVGSNNNPNNNSGYLDNIVAHSCGTVVAVQTNVTGFKSGSYGNYVKIKHLNGYYTLYAHLKYGTVKVKVGTQVMQGEVIGYMGNTGNSYGSHLHFEVRDTNDKKIDPTPYINADLPKAEKPKEETTDDTDVEVLELVKKTIRGDFGNGEERKKKLGNKYSEVQKQVNLNFKNKTTNWDKVRLY